LSARSLGIVPGIAAQDRRTGTRLRCRAHCLGYIRACLLHERQPQVRSVCPQDPFALIRERSGGVAVTAHLCRLILAARRRLNSLSTQDEGRVTDVVRDGAAAIPASCPYG